MAVLSVAVANSMKKRRTSWQLPNGVSSGTWDYAEADSIATEYDGYFGSHGLFRLDQDIAGKYLTAGQWVIDLGCGTGRAVKPLNDQGVEVVGFDLSQAMLDEAARKVADHQPAGKATGHFVRGNMVDLSGFADGSFDAALCLFSTLGMVRGHANRKTVVEHVARMLSSRGVFILQVHNYWAHLFDVEGPWWMLRNGVRSLVQRDVEIGDKFFPYRGIPNMYLHSFTKYELRRLLGQSGFDIEEWIPLNAELTGGLFAPQFLDGLRSSGWIVVARRKG